MYIVSVLDLIGNTPLVQINDLVEQEAAAVRVKLEGHKPASGGQAYS